MMRKIYRELVAIRKELQIIRSYLESGSEIVMNPDNIRFRVNDFSILQEVEALQERISKSERKQ